VKELLGAMFDVCDLGEATYFLGMEVTRDWEASNWTLKSTQKKADGGVVVGEVRDGGRQGEECANQPGRDIGEKRRAVGSEEGSVQ
jgi:hypothetical protein